MATLTGLQQELHTLLAVAELCRENRTAMFTSDDVAARLAAKNVQLIISVPLLLDGLRHGGYVTGFSQLSKGGDLEGMKGIRITAKGLERLRTTLRWRG